MRCNREVEVEYHGWLTTVVMVRELVGVKNRSEFGVTKTRTIRVTDRNEDDLWTYLSRKRMFRIVFTVELPLQKA